MYYFSNIIGLLNAQYIEYIQGLPKKGANRICKVTLVGQNFGPPSN